MLAKRQGYAEGIYRLRLLSFFEKTKSKNFRALALFVLPSAGCWLKPGYRLRLLSFFEKNLKKKLSSLSLFSSAFGRVLASPRLCLRHVSPSAPQFLEKTESKSKVNYSPGGYHPTGVSCLRQKLGKNIYVCLRHAIFIKIRDFS